MSSSRLNVSFHSVDDDEEQPHNVSLHSNTPAAAPRLLDRRSSSRSLRQRLSDSLRTEKRTKNGRLIHRDLTHFQSRNQLKIVNKHGGRHHRLRFFVSQQWHALMAEDWFHVLLRLPTWISLLAWTFVWTTMILVFAGFYIWVDSQDPDEDCGLGNGQDGDLGVISFHAAFAFSLETCTTVGYGLPGNTNAFFENCPTMQVVIYFQMLWSMIFNAFLLAFFFARVGRSETRGIQVLFGQQAILKQVSPNKFVFQVRVYDVDAPHPVVEAHVRLYAANLSWTGELQPLRITEPNDDLGAVLFTSVPTTVTHELDIYSPLAPPYQDKDNSYFLATTHKEPLRQFDGRTGNRDDFECPVCGETYGTFERLQKHVKYQQLVEGHDEYPTIGSHLELPDELTKPQEMSLQDVRNYVSTMEILCVVEGIDPLTSGTFQALQSYTVQDIVFGSSMETTFAQCVSHQEDKLVVDLDSFHKVVNKEEEEKNEEEQYDKES